MEAKQPVMLTVLVETVPLRWFVAGIGLDGSALPLLCSDAGDLEPYRGLEPDEQVSFLRHRFSGVLQRGCDRLWARQKKACQIVILFDGPLLQANGAQDHPLTRRIAEHFVEWMTNPPVAAFLSEGGFARAREPRLNKIVGDLAEPLQGPFQQSLPSLMEAVANPSAWELSPKKIKPATV